nr:immunoglobulin heavy chain junction region [Macaca mulatta]MOV36294.1 immunoglobulin heavy chain junction region [Macaca mulatta]
CQRRGENFDYW